MAREKSYLVSAIVSAYKSERFMRGLLEDLEAQTIANRLEIVVVDSASPENERDIVREFQKKRYDNIVYIRTPVRETTHAAFSRCARAAHGKYLTLACTDDRHKPDALERMVAVLDSRPDIALVYANSHITLNENETFDNHSAVRTYRWLDFDPLQLLYGCYMGPQPMWRKALHETYGYFDGALESAGDWEFWLRLAEKETFLHIDELLGLYLYSLSSSEHGNPERHRREISLVRERYIHREPELRERKRGAVLRLPAESGTQALIVKGGGPLEQVESCVQHIRTASATCDDLSVGVVRLNADVPENALGVNVSPRTPIVHEAVNEAAAWQVRHVLLVSPDAVVTGDSINGLVAVAESEDGIAAVGPVAEAAPAPQADVAQAPSPVRQQSGAAVSHCVNHSEVPYLGAFCLLLKSEALRRAGGLNSDLPLHIALWDLFKKLRDSGSKLACARGVRIRHSELTPDEGAAYDALAFAEAAAVSGELETAGTAFKTALQLDPANLYAQLGLAEVQRRQRKYGEARKCLKLASGIYPGNLDILAAFAALSLDLGGTENARRALEHIRASAPTHPAIHNLEDALKDSPTHDPERELVSRTSSLSS